MLNLKEMQLLERTQDCEPKYDLWPYKRWNTGGIITPNYMCVDSTMMHICTKFERNPSRNVACRAHTIFPPKYDLWPYKRWNTGGIITQNYMCVDLTMMHICTKFERNPSRNVACRVHTIFPPKYDLWPYKRWNTGGIITQNYMCVDLTMMHICTKFERNPSRNVACRAHTIFPPKYYLWPYKRQNTRGSITKNKRCVDFTKIHLYAKFERNPSRNAAVRAQYTRMWHGGGGGVMLLNPKYMYPPAVPDTHPKVW